jgi:hypothetical protein
MDAWELNGELVVDGDGAPIECAACPCGLTCENCDEAGGVWAYPYTVTWTQKWVQTGETTCECQWAYDVAGVNGGGECIAWDSTGWALLSTRTCGLVSFSIYYRRTYDGFGEYTDEVKAIVTGSPITCGNYWNCDTVNIPPAPEAVPDCGPKPEWCTE